MIDIVIDDPDATLVHATDCLEFMRTLPDRCIDLTITSSPYEDKRWYAELNFKMVGEVFVNWVVERFMEAYRITRGLTAFVIEGKTDNFIYSGVPILIMAELIKRGVTLRKPPIFRRVGISGSGGPDWLRNDYEFIICASHGKLPYAEPTALGHAPLWDQGGKRSNRHPDGRRLNAKNENFFRKRDGFGFSGQGGDGRNKNGTAKRKRLGTGQDLKGSCESLPKISNPGNVINERYTARQVSEILHDHGMTGDVIDCIVGGGVMGSDLSHENEAPFPERLPEFFIRSFSPEGGIVFDPFCGSGTTLAVAIKFARHAMGVDCRDSQIELSSRRIAEARTLRYLRAVG